MKKRTADDIDKFPFVIIFKNERQGEFGKGKFNKLSAVLLISLERRGRSFERRDLFANPSNNNEQHEWRKSYVDKS